VPCPVMAEFEVGSQEFVAGLLQGVTYQRFGEVGLSLPMCSVVSSKGTLITTMHVQYTLSSNHACSLTVFVACR
jgi:hypothetical protein